MADFKTGDIVVLTSGSMRMAVEGVEGDLVNTVWCNEGTIGRDQFPAVLLRKWEERQDDRPQRGGGFNKGGDRGGFNKGGRDDRGAPRDRDDRGPRPPMGRDGKPRDKKFFRKD
ncbi:MAG: hypothetical protein ACPGID_05095 [Rubricella sp.]